MVYKLMLSKMKKLKFSEMARKLVENDFWTFEPPTQKEYWRGACNSCQK